MKKEKYDKRTTFIRKPKPGNIVRVYDKKNNILCHGEVVRVVKALDPRPKINRQMQMAVIKKIDPVLSYPDIDFYLDWYKVIIE